MLPCFIYKSSNSIISRLFHPRYLPTFSVGMHVTIDSFHPLHGLLINRAALSNFYPNPCTPHWVAVYNHLMCDSHIYRYGMSIWLYTR